MLLLPNTLLVSNHRGYAVLIESEHKYATMIGGKLYRIPYYGYFLDVAILPYDRVVNHIRLIARTLPHKGTIALVQ